MNRAASPATPASAYLDAWRSYFDNGLQLVNAMLDGAERMREFQLGAAREVHARYAEIAGQLANATSMQDVVALQRALVRDYSHSAVRYWTGLTKLLQEAQVEVAGIVEKQGEKVIEQASAVSTQAPQVYGAPGELIAVMQSAFDAVAHPAAGTRKKVSHRASSP